MELPSFIGGKKESNVFVSAAVGRDFIQAGIWHVQDNKGALLSSGTASPWQENLPDSLVEAADDSLASAIGGLENPEEEPKLEQVVFGLPLKWIEDGKVKQDKLPLLKRLCDTLELKPAGFVVIPEALVFSVKQKEEGAGVSFILVGVDEHEIEITLVKTAKIVDTTYVSRSMSLGDDITEGLARFKTDNLPSRILLYNRHSSELAQIKSELSSWEWPVTTFSHTPRIEVLPEDSVITAVSEAGAIEIAHVTQFTEIVEENDEDIGHTEKNNQTIVEEPELVPISKPQVRQEQQVEEVEIGETREKASRLSIPKPPNPLKFFPSYPTGKRPPTFLIIVLILLVLGIVAFYFLPKASATVYLVPQKLEDRLDIIVSKTGESNGKLPSRNISGELTSEKTKQTSGRKTVGDRAKGQVTILNNTSTSRNFAAGVLLTGPNGLKFTLDAPITVASESGAPNYKPGEGKGQITAADIGATYNLASGNIFSLANFSTSSFAGKNDQAFTGGSSREVPSVEKTDLTNLESDLTSEILDEARSGLGSQLGPNEILVPESVRNSVISKSFSAKPGDEAETLNLRLTLRVEMIAVSKEDLEKYIRSTIESKIPKGLILESGHINVAFILKDSKEKTSDLNFSLNVTAPLISDINKEELKGKILGKTFSDAKKIFSALPGFSRVTIKLSPSLPGPLNRFPIRGSNIVLDIQPEQ